MKVRRAGKDDLEPLTSLFEAYRSFYRQRPDLAGSRAFLAERLERDDSVIFVAESEEGLLGFTQLYPLFSSTACRPIWLLNDLYIRESSRKRGVARALMERARLHAIETGASAIELATAHTNRPAQRLYESLGYAKELNFQVYSLKL